MYEDLPMRRVQELFMALLYGDQPAGWDIAGRKEVIKNLAQGDFLKYRSAHYLAQSTIVIIAGKFDDQKIVKDVERIFGGVKTGPKSSKTKTTEQQEKPGVLLRHKETDQTHLVLGVRAFDIFDQRKYALELLGDILGGGMSSRLFEKIRNEMGAAYYVRAGEDLFTDHGYLEASAGIDHNKIESVIEAILEEFRKLEREPLKQDELLRAQEHLVGNLMLGLETSDALAGFYGGQEVIKREIETPEKYAEKIRGVKTEEIQAVAQDIFQNNRLNLAVIGPLKNQEKLEKVLKL